MKSRVTLLLLGLAIPAARPATVEGHIRDALGHAAASATVEIQDRHGGQGKTVQCDRDGMYRFLSLAAGSYTLRARTPSTDYTQSGPFDLTLNETRTIDLAVKPAAAASVEFSDDTKFVVAGIADNTYLGGHGSETSARSAAALTKATAGLKSTTPGDALSLPQTETSLRAALEREPDNAGLHHTLGVAEESLGRPLDAVREYQRAAELDPNETNLFDWAAELLVHGAPQPAAGVFAKGSRLFPQSSRMLLGAAVTFYTQGDYAHSAEKFFAATDVNPADSGPYLILAKVQNPEITENPAYLNRLSRFAQLQPKNAWANYLYAAALGNAPENRAQAQALLERSVHLDPGLAPAHLQLGILYSEQANVRAAIDEYRRAILADPAMEQAHYRLAAAYRKCGELDKAQQETKFFERLAKNSEEQRQRERSELRRFVVTLKAPSLDH